MSRLSFVANTLVCVISLAGAIATAQAQQPAPPPPPAAAPASPTDTVPQPPQGMSPAEAKKWFMQRFKEADTNHDGKLTRDEAQAGMPEVYKRFDQIDVRKRGYVTERQVGAFWTKHIKDDMQKKNPIIN